MHTYYQQNVLKLLKFNKVDLVTVNAVFLYIIITDTAMYNLVQVKSIQSSYTTGKLNI